MNDTISTIIRQLEDLKDEVGDREVSILDKIITKHRHPDTDKIYVEFEIQLEKERQ